MATLMQSEHGADGQLPASRRAAAEASAGADAAFDDSLRRVLSGILAATPECRHVGWIGGRAGMLAAGARVLRQLRFEGAILACDWARRPLQGAEADVDFVDVARLSSVADLVLVDFGLRRDETGARTVSIGDRRPTRAVEALVQREFLALLSAETERQATHAPRSFVCIDGPPRPDERLVDAESGALGSLDAGGSGETDRRIVCGRISLERSAAASSLMPDPALVLAGNLIALMSIGEGGQRGDAGIIAPVGRRGVVLHGPHRSFPAGHYRADVTIRARSPWVFGAAVRPVILEIAVGAERLVMTESRFVGSGTLSATFHLAEVGGRQNVYLRVLRGRWVDFLVTSVRFTRLSK